MNERSLGKYMVRSSEAELGSDDLQKNYTKTDAITDKLRKICLQFYGHLCRMGSDSPRFTSVPQYSALPPPLLPPLANHYLANDKSRGREEQDVDSQVDWDRGRRREREPQIPTSPPPPFLCSYLPQRIDSQRHGGNTARLARRSDEALEVRVSVARAAVAQWLGRSPPTTAIRARYPAGLLPRGNRAGRCRSPGGLSRSTIVSLAPCIPAPLHGRGSSHVMSGDGGHLRVPAGKPVTRRVLPRPGFTPPLRHLRVVLMLEGIRTPVTHPTQATQDDHQSKGTFVRPTVWLPAVQRRVAASSFPTTLLRSDSREICVPGRLFSPCSVGTAVSAISLQFRLYWATCHLRLRNRRVVVNPALVRARMTALREYGGVVSGEDTNLDFTVGRHVVFNVSSADKSSEPGKCLREAGTVKATMQLRVQGQEARKRYGRQLHARLVPHRSYVQGVQCFRRDAGNHCKPKSGRPDQDVNPGPSECRSGSLPLCHGAVPKDSFPWTDYSPPTRANRARFLGRSPDFRTWESRRTMSMVSRFSRGYPASLRPCTQAPPHTSLRPHRHSRSDEALGVRVSVARNAPSLLDLGRGVPTAVHPTLKSRPNLSTLPIKPP
ncbi:hypothetical protein PR048_029513 [Dryococelus australis]|uniref:Uncharacterized protein n=1 Tax=Dryococelus australis TaxID=614101 RepID=A0ABQ9GDK3_9NEOP|nr:hypothetical protein PR048_029513 [Dryococelus australis]